LSGYLAEAKARGAQIVELAAGDPARRVLPPTLVLDAPDDCALLQEEIFGPILPLVACETVEAGIEYVNARPRPLAFYLFDLDRDRVERALSRVVAGGVAVNDTVLQFAQSELPFGGVGPSGMGGYHGHQSFLTFCKPMPVLYQARLSSMRFMRPPYGKLADFLVRFLTR
jgi:coniferyl-aldehyde dehydrogenase